MKLELPPALLQANEDETLPIHKIEEWLGLKTPAAKEFLRVALENTILMDRKQMDYGSRNISSFAILGVLVRMNDKMERLKNLFGKGRRRKAVNESIKDSLRDISNYACIGIMLENGKWPDE
jgi:hypothetical protein